MISNYEYRQKELMVENSELRQCLSTCLNTLHTELVGILSNTATSVRPAMPMTGGASVAHNKSPPFCGFPLFLITWIIVEFLMFSPYFKLLLQVPGGTLQRCAGSGGGDGSVRPLACPMLPLG